MSETLKGNSGRLNFCPPGKSVKFTHLRGAQQEELGTATLGVGLRVTLNPRSDPWKEGPASS